VVLVQHADGTPVGTVTAGADGAWSLPLPDPGQTNVALVAVQTDPAGNTSVASSELPIELLRPEITVPSPDATIPSDGGATVVEVRFGGTAGERVQVLIDGVPTGNIHTLEAAPLIRSTAPLADGAHTIAVRYIDVDTGAVGTLDLISFTIG
jgi:hypothetical protein